MKHPHTDTAASPAPLPGLRVGDKLTAMQRADRDLAATHEHPGVPTLLLAAKTRPEPPLLLQVAAGRMLCGTWMLTGITRRGRARVLQGLGAMGQEMRVHTC